VKRKIILMTVFLGIFNDRACLSGFMSRDENMPVALATVVFFVVGCGVSYGVYKYGNPIKLLYFLYESSKFPTSRLPDGVFK